jgi:predicted MFS family arabinose efflux permease
MTLDVQIKSIANYIPRLGLCITNDLGVFTGISFIVSVTTVTPQLMMPLVGDLAPPHRRAAALSVVVSGRTYGQGAR